MKGLNRRNFLKAVGGGAATLAVYDENAMPVPDSWHDDLRDKPTYLRDSRSRKQALSYGYDRRENIQRHFRRYYAAITEMDAAVGRVLKAVDDLGLRDNTYILFIGDNGWFMSEHGFTSKVLPYEESIRVPMIVAGPGIAARIDNHMVLNIDLAPTILELAGVRVPENIHGLSLVPLLKNRPVDWRKSFLYEAPTPSLGSWPLMALRTERYKYVRTFDLDERAKLVFEELYDLRRDLKEMTNLADDPSYRSIKQQLAAELEQSRNAIES